MDLFKNSKKTKGVEYLAPRGEGGRTSRNMQSQARADSGEFHAVSQHFEEAPHKQPTRAQDYPESHPLDPTPLLVLGEPIVEDITEITEWGYVPSREYLNYLNASAMRQFTLTHIKSES